jgi:hypothetical protein
MSATAHPVIHNFFWSSLPHSIRMSAILRKCGLNLHMPASVDPKLKGHIWKTVPLNVRRKRDLCSNREECSTTSAAPPASEQLHSTVRPGQRFPTADILFNSTKYVRQIQPTEGGCLTLKDPVSWIVHSFCYWLF